MIKKLEFNTPLTAVRKFCYLIWLQNLWQC